MDNETLARKHGIILAAVNSLLIAYATITTIDQPVGWVMAGFFLVANGSVFMTTENLLADHLPRFGHWISYILFGLAFVIQGLYGAYGSGLGFLSFWGIAFIVGLWIAGYGCVICPHIFWVAFRTRGKKVETPKESDTNAEESDTQTG